MLGMVNSSVVHLSGDLSVSVTQAALGSCWSIRSVYCAFSGSMSALQPSVGGTGLLQRIVLQLLLIGHMRI
jgi:hypothetical protein